jgi:hypothetical protein
MVSIFYELDANSTLFNTPSYLVHFSVEKS